MSRITHLGPVRLIDGDKYLRNIYIEKTPNFDLGAALLSKFDVLDKIFSYLSYKDLSSIAQLSDLWRSSVDLILKKRLKPNFFTYGLVSCYNLPESVNVKPLLTVIFIKCNDMKLDKFICLHENNGVEARKSIIESIQNNLLIANCPIVALTCRQILSSFTSNILLNGLVFPCIPNINISIFRIGKQKTEITTILNKYINKDNHILCLLTFGICLKKRVLLELIYQIQQRQPTIPFALGGGFVKGMQSFNTLKLSTYHSKDDYLCMAFTKPANIDVHFNAYSIIIPEDGGPDEDIEQYFIDLKSHYMPRKHGIAFRITCISVQDEVDKEIKLFKKHFPDIELLGFDGDGEIGWDCYKFDEPSDQKRQKIERKPKIFHSFTTIIVLFTWGKVINKYT